jgi:cytochrome c2
LVFHLALLILLCLPAFSSASEGAVNRCLACHQEHHQEYGTCTDCHRGDPRSSRLNIAHFGLIQARHAWFNLPDTPQVEQGTRHLETYACRRCHISGDKGNRLATNLDRSIAASDPLTLVEAIRNPVRLMPDFHLPESRLDTLINALFSLGRDVDVVSDEMPQVVHFEARERMEENLFVKHCGGCHQALTATLGGLGDGMVAPNLSGLLTGFYPETAKDNAAWNRENLKEWLKNPRDIRPLTPMMPVRLEDEELTQLFDLIDEDISLLEKQLP